MAAILCEPVAVNGGLIAARDGFLEALRDGRDPVGALLVFDEVITGFRVALGGAQERRACEPTSRCSPRRSPAGSR